MAHLQASEVRRLVDKQCDAFERAWSNGDRPAIGDLLDAVPEEGRPDLFGELLALELELRARAGEGSEIGAYKDQYSSYDKVIERAFDEFHSWAESTDVLDAALKSRFIPSDQDTQARALETREWSPEGAAPLGSQGERPDTLDADIPRQIGRYKVLRKLGQGGMGTVVLAHDAVLDRKVALKLPRFDPRDGAEAIERFYREARAMATVHHPNLCPIYDVGEHDGCPYLTMAYIDGQSLTEEIDSAGPIEPHEAVRLVRKLALAMHVAHEAGILHRDLKPSNVMIDQKGEPFITDFGLASRDCQTEAELTQSGMVIGSPAYMAPEQVSGSRGAVGPHTDVYAFGVILYQLLCGRRPFEGAVLAVLGQITSGKSPTPLSTVADVDEQLEAICLKAMAHDVDSRFQSAAELAEALRTYLDHDPARRRKRDGPRSTSLARSRVLVVVVTLFLAAGVLATIIFKGLPRANPEVDLPRTATAGIAADFNNSDGVALQGAEELASHLLPSQPVPAKTSTGEFYDSGQELEGDDSQGVASGDLDGDGDLDVVVANLEEPNHVWLNDGAGRFENHQELAGEETLDVALGDLDGDGDLDAAFASRSPSNPGGIWLNDGEGRFTDTGWKLAGEEPWKIVFADIDGDADLDAVVANAHGPNRVFRSDGSGHLLDSGQRLGSGQLLGSKASKALGVGDLDGDGDIDIFVCNYFERPNRVWLNDGRGNFSDSGQALGATKSHGVALTDVDHDGDLDAYVVNADAPDALWINDGSGTFSVTTPFSHVLSAGAIGMADLDGNGRTDFFIVNGLRGTAEPAQILLAKGEAVGFDTYWSQTTTASDVALADFDGDGDIDAFVTNVGDHSNRVWFNRDIDEPVASLWSFEFRDSGQELGSASSRCVELGDLDGDGDLDAVIANGGSDPNPIWWNDGHGRFRESELALGMDFLRDLALGDLDDDDDLDVFLACEDGPNTVWLNDGKGRFSITEQQIGQSNSAQVALADFDGDGDLDAWVGNLNPHHDRVWINDGTGRFTDSGQVLGKERNWSVETGDIDGDGDVDVLVGTSIGEPNSLWLNDGRGHFTRGDEALSGTTGSNGFYVGDLDGDGTMDLFETYYSGSDRVWLNDGAGHFTETGQVFPSLRTRQARLADLDGDEDLDVVVSGLINGPNYALVNGGTGRFEDRVQPFGNSDSKSMALGDLDGDGDLDVFVANYSRQPNRVWLNEPIFDNRKVSTGLPR
ncbi:MAG: hypothetical protein CMJ84_10005 [Planctomycetes bacterium]|nr:hypothetical protein [Planctomycetota bacterium]